MKTFKIILILIVTTISIQGIAQEPIRLAGEELFGTMRARHIGPAVMSGRITDLAGHPTNSKIIYAGTAGGGIWKSSDGGVMFNSIFDDYNQSIGTIAIDPSDPDHIIWAGTGETWTRNSISPGDGLYKSIDGGTNWKKVGFAESDHISSIQINPNNSNEVYVGILGPLWGDSDKRGVYKTTDGGEIWEQLLAGNLSTGCSDLIMDPNNPDILYAAFWEFRRTAWSFNSGGKNSALYKSNDGGKNWNKIHNGFPEGVLGRFAFAVAPTNSNILYGVVESEDRSKCGLYRSENAGESWIHLNKDFELAVRPFYFSRIVIDPRDENVVVKCGLFGSISRDGGKTFKNLGPQHPDIHDIWFDINNSDIIFSGTDGGVYQSFNGTATFDMVDNLPLSQFYFVSVDNEEPYNVYGGLQDNGSWYGPSSSPGGVEAGDWKPIGGGDGFRAFRHPTKNIIYSEIYNGEGIYRYDLDKNIINTIQPFPEEGDPKFRYNWNTALQLSPNKPDRVYVGNQFLFRSEDMGNNWEKVSPDLSTNDLNKQGQTNSGGISVDNSGAEMNTTIYCITESPLDENLIWVGTDDGNVQITMDAGKNWTNVVSNIPDLPANTWCNHIEASNFNKGTAYAVFDGHYSNDNNPYVYKTTDFGKTWKSIATSDIENFARHIKEDYVNENILYLGTETGLYITIDGGISWVKFTNNMPSASVHYIALHPKKHDLVLATHGRGIIIIDDISPLREINQEILQKKAHFFESTPTVIWEQGSFGGNSTFTQFVGRNPNRNAKIIYYLKKRHTFGKMTIEIFNSNGELVGKADPGKKKGINIVHWDYIMKPPVVAKGKTYSRGGFSTLQLPADNYKLVMKKGKEVYESNIELIYDPNSSISLEDRKLKFDLSKKLFDLTQDLAYLVYEIDVITEYVNNIDFGNDKSSKVAKSLTSELTELKKTLVITTGDNYVQAADPELREKIGNLYSVVVGNSGKPSNTHYKNFKMHNSAFEAAIVKYDVLKKKQFSKIEKFVEKNELPSVTMKSFEEFLKQ
ncbi:MAG: hypothetical protein KOO66_01795 [Bacteroidales bacterium]|nr:hypothetical protein [Bacteroidales bacterium]